MELKELTDKTLELFEVKSVEQLGQQLLEVCKGTDKLEAFCNLVGGDLTQDWMQKKRRTLHLVPMMESQSESAQRTAFIR